MKSVVYTHVFVGGPADGTKITLRDPDGSSVKIAQRQAGFDAVEAPLGPWPSELTHTYERTVIGTEDADYVFWKLEGMSQGEVLRRLFTRYHGA